MDPYGFRWEPGRARFWVFLEDAGRMRLTDSQDFSEWIEAARWAARFHASTRELPPARTAFLPRWGRAHYRRCADRVARLLPTVDAADRDIVQGGLDALTAHLDWLSTTPRSVIHGQFFGENIMLRPRRAGPRIAVIDWETAALGPRAFDLASLTTGNWSDEKHSAIRRAYFEEYQSETGQISSWDDFCGELDVVAMIRPWNGWSGGPLTDSFRSA